MQKTYKGLTAKQIIDRVELYDDRAFVKIAGTSYTVTRHSRLDLANGNWTRTVVLENPERRVVLEEK